MKLNQILKLIVIVALVTSCDSRPNIEDLEESLSKEISLESSGNFELISITKNNAIERNFFGQEVYSIQYSAKLKVLKDCWTYIDKSGLGRYLTDFKTYDIQPGFNGIMAMPAKCIKGDIVSFQDEVNYINTENGWIKEGLNY